MSKFLQIYHKPWFHRRHGDKSCPQSGGSSVLHPPCDFWACSPVIRGGVAVVEGADGNFSSGSQSLVSRLFSVCSEGSRLSSSEDASDDPQMKVLIVAPLRPSGPSWASSGTFVPNGSSGRQQQRTHQDCGSRDRWVSDHRIDSP